MRGRVSRIPTGRKAALGMTATSAQPPRHCEERSDAAIRISPLPRILRIPTTSVRTGLGMTASSAQPPPSLRGAKRRGNPHLSSPPYTTDSHTSDVGHWLGMTASSAERCCHCEERSDAAIRTPPTAPVIARSEATRQSVLPVSGPRRGLRIPTGRKRPSE